MHEVHRIFKDFDQDGSGTIEPAEFMPLLARLLRQPASEMDAGTVWECWDAIDSDGSGKVSFDEFTAWYCRTFHVERPDFTHFISKDIVPREQVAIRGVGKKIGLDNVAIESIYKEFVKFDTDRSGLIDLQEFKELLQQRVVPHGMKHDVPPKVLERFWLDIDADGSGTVSFEEFATWYAKFFFGDLSPMEQYYQMLGTGYHLSVLNF
mmetsp:Transcript_23134/g.59018  ORF Transcript_23134/g.59018 Transcript_23134/m.59018 type:complete len:208 (+) Transcript_23134:1-624(+)